MLPQYPIYIVSKGRWESRYTVKTLEKMKVPYLIVVEEQEFDNYASVIDKEKIIVLDKTYQDNYDTLDDLGNTKSKGPGAARNFVWEHAIKSGAKWHWVMDDNIKGFVRLIDNKKIRVYSASAIRIMEDFINRYENIAMAGPHYDYFVARKSKYRPFNMNSRIYSCNLIRNDIPFRWRGRYNEDTDLSLRILKAGYCTIQFYAILQEKVTTQVVRGGNTDDFYLKEGTLPKSQMLVRTHPDVATLVWRYGRWHHKVDYSQFRRNKLKRKEGLVINDKTNNYNLELVVNEYGKQREYN